MTQKELEQIQVGDFISHKHFGLCLVDKVEWAMTGAWFGLAIRPLTVEGFMTLAYWSGCLFNRMLENSKRLIIRKVENPEIPKLIFETETGFDVHEWVELGEVSSEGKFSSKKIQEFIDANEALAFANGQITPTVQNNVEKD